MKPLQGRVTINSCEGRGIGRAGTWKLAPAGAAVVVNDCDEAPAAKTSVIAGGYSP